MHSPYQLESWHSLYIMLGGSSAALIGLLFVAATLHIREIVNNPMFKIRVQYSTLILIGTLIQAAAILTPQPARILGVELLALNLWGLSFPIGLTYTAMMKPAAKRGGYSIYRGVSFISGFVLGVAGSIVMIVGAEWGLYLVTVCYVSSLIATVWNAWAMMLGIGRGERKIAR
jgi:hypothetical protein